MRRLKRQPTDNIATAALRQEILAGSLAPGTRLRQEQLAARLGVSRMPVRQALAVLEGEGLVKTDPWRGTIVAPLDPDAIRDMYAFRGMVERYVAFTLATREAFNVGAIRELIAAGREAATKGDLTRLIGLDLRFHSRLWEAVGNRIVVDVMRGHWAHISRVMAVTLTFTGYRTRVWDEHAAILEAIAEHDAERAGALAESHIAAASTMVMKSLEDRISETAGQTESKQTRVNSATTPVKRRPRSAKVRHA
jgi:DNA-binding GntR family transcriptional regulator